MNDITVFAAVNDFIEEFQPDIRAEAYRLIDLLAEHGHQLSMPYAKPIGGGLWELRLTGRPQVRMLYGFCDGVPVVVLAIVKQRSALRQGDLALARKRFKGYCD